jgi:hypothetical protein
MQLLLLFHEFKEKMAEDYQRLYNNQREFSDDIKFAMLSLDIKQHLTERNMMLQNYDFLDITQELREMCTTIKDKFCGRQVQQWLFQLEQIDYNPEEESSAFQQNYAKLDPEQQVFVDRVISSINNNSFRRLVHGCGSIKVRRIKGQFAFLLVPHPPDKRLQLFNHNHSE